MNLVEHVDITSNDYYQVEHRDLVHPKVEGGPVSIVGGGR